MHMCGYLGLVCGYFKGLCGSKYANRGCTQIRNQDENGWILEDYGCEQKFCFLYECVVVFTEVVWTCTDVQRP